MFHSAPGRLDLARAAKLDNVSLVRADDGLGKGFSLARAFRLIGQAAGDGDAAAMFTLSNMLEAGEGVRKDGAGAVKWLEAAAEQENPEALQQLALHLQDGTMGYAADPARSALLMREAAHAMQHRAHAGAGH